MQQVAIQGEYMRVSSAVVPVLRAVPRSLHLVNVEISVTSTALLLDTTENWSAPGVFPFVKFKGGMYKQTGHQVPCHSQNMRKGSSVLAVCTHRTESVRMELEASSSSSVHVPSVPG